MPCSRRCFLGAGIAAGILPGLTPLAARPRRDQDFLGYDPWVEVVEPHLDHNLSQVRRLTKDRPVLAVIKNNGYGLGLVETARLLEPREAILGFAVVKTDAAIRLRDAGIQKPILHMGLSTIQEGHELVARDIQLSLYTDDALKLVSELSNKAGHPVKAQAYLDTGLGRMGMPYHRAAKWIVAVSQAPQVDLQGTFMAFTEEADFDPDQLERFESFLKQVRDDGARLGRIHASSSNGVFHLPRAHFDIVRPGIALFGGYPARPIEEMAKATLQPALRFRCRVVRVEQLRTGDSAGYGRKYIAQRPTWVATLPAGHVDGVTRTAVQGQRVLIGENTFPVIGAVSASHCLLEIGEDPRVQVGDVATIMGPDHEDIHPNTIESTTGTSVYDVFMHLNPDLPRHVVAS